MRSYQGIRGQRVFLNLDDGDDEIQNGKCIKDTVPMVLDVMERPGGGASKIDPREGLDTGFPRAKKNQFYGTQVHTIDKREILEGKHSEDISSIDAENMAILDSMTNREISEAQRDIQRILGKSLTEKIANRNVSKSFQGQTNEQKITTHTQEDTKSVDTKSDKTAYVNPRSDDIKNDIRKVYFTQENDNEKVKSDQGKPYSDNGIKKVRFAPEKELRVNIKGRVWEEETNYEKEWGEFTVKQIVELTRSSYAAQRCLAWKIIYESINKADPCETREKLIAELARENYRLYEVMKWEVEGKFSDHLSAKSYAKLAMEAWENIVHHRKVEEDSKSE